MFLRSAGGRSPIILRWIVHGSELVEIQGIFQAYPTRCCTPGTPAIIGNIWKYPIYILTNSFQDTFCLSTSLNDSRGTCMTVDPSNMQDEHCLAIGAAGSLPNLLHMTR